MLNFLKDYILILKERDELDWLIYQLIQAKGYTPLKNPFTRTSKKKLKAKRGESEYGIDLSCFKDKGKKHLIIFVLKNEKLTATSWKKGANFQADLMDAVSTNLVSDPVYKNVETVNIILAYNKDENAAGKKSFDDFVKKWSKPTEAFRRKIPITINRWNIETITDEIANNIYSGEILPWEFNSFFNYLCTQAKEFSFNSENWEKIFVPAWRDFLIRITGGKLNKKTVILTNLCVDIFEKTLRDKDNHLPSQIDITEWALLRLSSLIFKDPKKHIKELIFFFQTTLTLYKTYLEKYLEENRDYFTSPQAGANPGMMSMGVILDSRKAHWNISRMGVLALLYYDLISISSIGEKSEKITKKEKEVHEKYVEELANALSDVGDLLEKFVEQNDSTKRPLIDLDHIQLFLIWAVFHMSGKPKAFYNYMMSLKTNLALRKVGAIGLKIPFIEDHNRLDLVSEYVALDSKPLTYSSKTSYYLMVTLELCFSFHPNDCVHLLEQFYHQIIFPDDHTDGEKLEEESINLVSWNPPQNWEDSVFEKDICREGSLVSLGNFETFSKTNQSLSEKIELFVKNSINTLSCKERLPMIRSLVVLACLKNKNPLPSALWRTTIFREFYNKNVSK